MGASLALLALLAGTGSAVARDQRPIGQRVDAISVPSLTGTDTAMAGRVLGSQSQKPLNRGRSTALGVPAGATRFRETVWQIGSRKLGVARVYVYDDPVDVPARTWRFARFLEGESSPFVSNSSFGIDGLKEVEVLVDTDGRVVSVLPYSYRAMAGPIRIAPLPAGKQEAGERGAAR